jgi:hypothetical protein
MRVGERMRRDPVVTGPRKGTRGDRRSVLCVRPVIARGQAYAVAGTVETALVHLGCYLFWLHASGVYSSEPVTCASCRKLIPPHAERTVIHGEAYHSRCWVRMQSPAAALARGGSL